MIRSFTISAPLNIVPMRKLENEMSDTCWLHKECRKIGFEISVETTLAALL
jgi:hypothetical protein